MSVLLLSIEQSMYQAMKTKPRAYFYIRMSTPDSFGGQLATAIRRIRRLCGPQWTGIGGRGPAQRYWRQCVSWCSVPQRELKRRGLGLLAVWKSVEGNKT